MASIRIYCDCKLREIGTAIIDLYSPRFCGKGEERMWRLMGGKEPCRHCGRDLRIVGATGSVSEREANRIDSRLMVR